MAKSNLSFVVILVLAITPLLLTVNNASATISAPTPITGSQLPPPTASTTNSTTPTTPQTVPISPSAEYQINQVKSGIVVIDSLTNETKSQQQLQANPGYWRYGGDAPLENAPYVFFRNTTGLYIGAQAPSNGTWAGYYAVTQNTTAMLFHAIVSTPLHMIPSTNNWFENGMYVQNGTFNVSYIVCNAITSSIGTQWVISVAKGDANEATGFTNYWWSSMDKNQPLTRDCTIITNGHNYLKVYLDGNKVFESHTMNLNYINPMVAFLEPQSNYNGMLLNGTYKDFYALTNENVTVTNTPTGARTVEIVKPTSSCYGTVLANGTVDSSGIATLSIGQYDMPVGGYIQVYDGNGNLLASTPNEINVYGGDVYSANQLSPANTVNTNSNTAQCTATVPTNLTAAAKSPSKINLSWTAPSGATALPSGYKIERSTDGGTTWSTIQSNTGSTSTTYSDSGLAASTPYAYRVSAIYVSTTSQPSNAATATTQCVTCQLIVIAANSTDNSIQGLYGTLSQNGTQVESGFTPDTFTLKNGIQYSVTVYNYPPNAFDHWMDTGSNANPRTMTITNNTQITAWFVNGSPQQPTNLTATTTSQSQINLSWTTPSKSGGSAITGYVIERSTDGGTTWSTIVTNTGSTLTTYSDTGLVSGTAYTYRVSAINSFGTSSPSNTASATTLPPTVPTPPTNLTATVASQSQINLSWTTPSNNGGSTIIGYKIERSLDGGNTWSTVNSNTNSTNATYSDTGLAASSTYTYRVSAMNSVGPSSPSNTASATTPSALTVSSSPTNLVASATSTSQINLSWTAPSNSGGSSITGYKIERSTDGGTTWSTIQSNTGSTNATYSDTGLAASTTYAYRVSAINSVGTSSPSNIANATTQSSGTGGTSSIILNNVKSTSGNTNQIKISSFNAGTGTNRLLVVGVEANKQAVKTITFNGVPLTKATSSFNNNDAEFWYLVNPSGTANIVVTMVSGTPVIVGAYSFSGVDPTNPIPTTATSFNSAVGSPSISITTKNTNSWVLDSPSIWGGVRLGSPTCTQNWDINIANQITGASSSTMTPSPGSITCGWTANNGGDLWDDIAIEIKASD